MTKQKRSNTVFYVPYRYATVLASVLGHNLPCQWNIYWDNCNEQLWKL